MRISSPPTTGPCYYGIDTPTQERADRVQPHGRGDPRAASGPTAWPTSRTRACWRRWATRRASRHCTRLLLRPLPGGGVAGRGLAARAVREGARPEPRAACRACWPWATSPGTAAPGGRRAGRLRLLRARWPRGKLGWEAAVLTARRARLRARARPARRRRSSSQPSPATTRFVNEYDADGTRRQVLLGARRRRRPRRRCPTRGAIPDVLLLAPVAGEIAGGIGARLRGRGGGRGRAGLAARVRRRRATCRARDVGRSRSATCAGVHVLFLSQHDLPEARRARRASCLSLRADRGADARLARASRSSRARAEHDVPALPRAGGRPHRRRRRLRGRVPRALPGDGRPAGGGGLRRLRGLVRGGGRRRDHASATAPRSSGGWSCASG